MTRQTWAFAERIIQWQRDFGRHDLPWQGNRDPYRVWLSEIMLQQTQVATVKAYFTRFVAQFPDIVSLAAAHEDAVLGLWSGLGYYTRARNLHRCAQAIVAQYGGAFPQDAAVLAQLPGIGQSTAAAISAVCFGQRVSILDANVRRVLTRFAAYDADLAQAAALRGLWQLAEQLLPAPPVTTPAMQAYTQGLMDLGALVCVPRKPLCTQCPVKDGCQAHAQGEPLRFPVRTRKLRRSSASLWLLQLQDAQGAVWLVRRPAPGIWAGLYCLPVFDDEAALKSFLPAALQTQCVALPVVAHVLTHRDLYLHTFRLTLAPGVVPASVLPSALEPAHSSVQSSVHLQGRWCAADEWPALGLPAPIRTLLSGV